MLGAGDTQEMEPIQASMAPGGIARRSHEGQWRGGAWAPNWRVLEHIRQGLWVETMVEEVRTQVEEDEEAGEVV